MYSGRIVDLWIEEVDLPNGHHLALEVIHHPGAAAITAIDPDGAIVLVRQYRHAVGGYILELPAGKLDRGELPATCALRELREETGLEAGELIELGSIVTTPGFCNERIHLFLARGLTDAQQALEQDEVLTVLRVPLAHALEMIRRGEIQDAKSIAGLHLATAWLQAESGSSR